MNKNQKWEMKNERQETNFSSCVGNMKNFASRINRAGNIKRQAKRIESFKTIIDQKETIIGELKSHIQQNTCGKFS